MLCSSAACRTVLPFSTVIRRPSIVSVTVSIGEQQPGGRESFAVPASFQSAWLHKLQTTPDPKYIRDSCRFDNSAPPAYSLLDSQPRGATPPLLLTVSPLRRSTTPGRS